MIFKAFHNIMRKYIIIPIVLFFTQLPLAMAQNGDMSDEIAKAVDKAVNEKLVVMRSELKKELLSHFNNYASELHGFSFGKIVSFQSETQTVNVAVSYRRVVNGEMVNVGKLAVDVPVLVPVGGNATVSRGDTCLVLFSNPNTEDKNNPLNQAGLTTASDIVAIIVSSPKDAQSRNVGVDTKTIKADLNRIRFDVQKHQKTMLMLMDRLEEYFSNDWKPNMGSLRSELYQSDPSR